MSATDRRGFLQMGSVSLLATVRLKADTTYEAASAVEPSLAAVKALTFDTFGTVVDYRSTIIAEGEALGKAKGLKVDWARFADAWRSGYAPAMNRVRTGELPWTKLDALHRMTLDRLLREFNITGLSEPEIDHLNHVWHRLKPWPDAVSGLTRLKKKFVIAPLSNGNLALLTNMAKHAGLPWDCILGAELARHYKPDRETYLTAAELLDLKPSEIMMVAAHQDDLGAARPWVPDRIRAAAERGTQRREEPDAGPAVGCGRARFQRARRKAGSLTARVATSRNVFAHVQPITTMTKSRLILGAALISVTLSPAFILHGQFAADGDIELKITEGTMFAAVASPDRRSIAIDLLGALWILPIDGGNATKITPDTIEARRPSWSADSQSLAFQGYDDGWHIYTIKTDGTGLKALTNGPFDDREPDWSRDASASRSRPTDTAASPQSGKLKSTAAPCVSCPNTSATIRAGRRPIET